MHRDSPSWGFEDAFWEVLGAHLPAFFLLLNWIVGSCTIAPMIWLLVGFVLGYGPSRLSHLKTGHGICVVLLSSCSVNATSSTQNGKSTGNPKPPPGLLLAIGITPPLHFKRENGTNQAVAAKMDATRHIVPSSPRSQSMVAGVRSQHAVTQENAGTSSQHALRKCDYSNFPSHDNELLG